MVDVSRKPDTVREATAEAVVVLPAAVARRFRRGEWHGPKGPVLQTAALAGTMAAKRTGDLIPLCHPLPIDACAIDAALRGNRVRIVCTVRTTGKTGVEMEALTAATVAALTVYDMCKALSHGIVIRSVRLLSKTGGKSDFKADRA